MSAAGLELVDELYAERYRKPVAPVAPVAPMTFFGPTANCQERGCRAKAVLAIQIPGLDPRRTCPIHLEDSLDAIGLTGQVSAVIARINP